MERKNKKGGIITSSFRKDKNKIIGLGLFILIVAFLVGCSLLEKKNYLVIAHHSAFINLDPQMNEKPENGQIIAHLFEGLVRIIDGKIVPGACDSYQISPDGLTYTFHLRDNKWADFKNLTAENFAYGWFRAIEPGKDYIYAPYFFPIQNAKAYYEGKASKESVGIKALDESTLEVTLEAPTPWFLAWTSYWFFSPVRQDIVEQYPYGSWALNEETCMGNGPFQLSQVEAGEYINLVRNDSYWNVDKVSLDGLQYLIRLDAKESVADFEEGDLDLVLDVPMQKIPLLQMGNEEYKEYSSYETLSLGFNLNREVLKDVNLRKALIYALNREEIARKAFSQYHIETDSVVPYGILDFNEDVFAQKAGSHNLVWDSSGIIKAKAWMAERKEKKMETPKLSFIVSEDIEEIQMAEEMQKMWLYNVGIETEIIIDSEINIEKKKRAGAFDLCFIKNNHIEKDPYAYLAIFATDHPDNLLGLKDASYDALLKTAQNQANMLRYQTLYEAENLLMNHYALLPLYNRKEGILIRKDIKGYTRDPIGTVFFGRAYR